MKKVLLFILLINLNSLGFGQSTNTFLVDSTKTYRISDDMLIGDQLDSLQIVDKNPFYVFGADSIKAYYDRVKLPDETKNYFGRLFIMFIVDPNGNVQQAKFLRCSMPQELFVALIKATNKMTNWIPAIKNNKRVSCINTLSFTISLGKAKVRYKL